MPRSLAREHDLLKLPAPKQPPKRTSRRIGIHTSIAGGVENAAERAWRLGCSAFQIFSSSPRQWKPAVTSLAQIAAMKRLRQQYDLKPLVIHSNYLINMAAVTPQFYAASIRSFRGEVERGLALGAEYLVLHPGSFRGASRADGLARTALAIEEATEGLDLRGGRLTILIENTAGAEYSLGGSFDHLAALLEVLHSHVPVAACIDTCHTHVSGYDIVTEKGYEATLRQLEATVGLRNVPVWHCNDAKAACGSRLDRHQHIGRGTIGLEPFRRLLNDPRLAHAAFIAETPIDAPGDDARNVETLKSLVEQGKASPPKASSPRRPA
jgi:deoxyribonuclease-4